MAKTVYGRPPKVAVDQRQWPDTAVTTAPRWCAVDLRDGNQALPDPMTPQQKREYFKLLCDIGFKEIEIGFPAASKDDFDFCRELIEKGMVPDDVTISVLTQAREGLIDRTMEALEGVKHGIVHFYIATSDLHRQFVFGLERQQLLDRAAASARQIRAAVDAMPESAIGLEFSPEEFTDTDLDFAVEICDTVVAAWGPRPGEIIVLNLPQTVERRLPGEYADMIEEFRRRQQFVDQTVLSLHVHNDMGMAVAATMQGLQAGAGRVEGTLFGHGERTGNVDLVTVALNCEYLGVDTGLDFSDLLAISSKVEEVTGIRQHPRAPYAGELVFTAFSGSHQDAIHKGLAKREALTEHFGGWKIPYLHVAPTTLGRSFERFIRINSQSGKGGIAHVMEQDYHVRMPRWVQVNLAGYVQAYADEKQRELSSAEVWQIFQRRYCQPGPIQDVRYWPRPAEDNPEMIEGETHLTYKGEPLVLKSQGNGPISAFVHAIRTVEGIPEFSLREYEEETRGDSADAEAVCFIRVHAAADDDQRIGVGFGSNIDQAAVQAVVAALNALMNEVVDN